MDENKLKKCREELGKLTSDQPKMYHDYREILAKGKLDIVIVATPDHWHAFCCIAATESGANVFMEKPVWHTVMEGRAMLNAARKLGRIVQLGTLR